MRQQQRPLTGRQLDVLECVREFIKKHGWPPTRAEIAGILQFKSANAAEEHLRAIEAKGFIEIVRGTARGIKLTQPKPKDLFVNPWAQQEKIK